MTELKPCPWPECDGNADVKSDMPPFFVQCRTCECQGPHCETEDEAIAAWNRRPSAGAEPEVVEAAARAVCATHCLVKKLPYDCNCVCWHEHADDVKTVLALLSLPRSVKDEDGQEVMKPMDPC